MADNSKFITTGKTGVNNHVNGTPLTTDVAREAAPGLMLNAIDKAVVKVRPMGTPLDQISRLGHVRPVDAMEVDYYSVDTRADSDILLTCKKATDIENTDQEMFLVKVQHPSRFEVTDTFTVRSGNGEGVQEGVAYIADKKADGTLVCACCEDVLYENMPTSAIVRMGRAATELDVQTPQFSALPIKSTNLCQIFKMQVEQSLAMKMSHKEIGWTFNDQQEAAVFDMRLGMEKQFLFGKKSKLYDPVKNETVTLTEGIWHQAGREIEVDIDNLDSAALVDMLREAFQLNSGSRRKVLMAGSALIAALNKIEHTHVITARDQVTAWGIDFSELQSKFGRLYVVYSDIFDIMNMPGNGLIIDPEYVQKHVFIPFSAQTLDLRGSGQRNTEAVVLTEASCLTLRYPATHARIVAAEK